MEGCAAGAVCALDEDAYAWRAVMALGAPEIDALLGALDLATRRRLVATHVGELRDQPALRAIGARWAEHRCAHAADLGRAFAHVAVPGADVRATASVSGPIYWPGILNDDEGSASHRIELVVTADGRTVVDFCQTIDWDLDAGDRGVYASGGQTTDVRPLRFASRAWATAAEAFLRKHTQYYSLDLDWGRWSAACLDDNDDADEEPPAKRPRADS